MIAYDTPEWAARFPELIVAQSQRIGGCSPPHWASLNLGLHTHDAAANVKQNILDFTKVLGFTPSQLATSYQIHGTDIKHVRQAGQTKGFDALVTATRGIVLGISIADCTPILIYDPVNNAVGAAHAGWRGTVGQIAAGLIRSMYDNFGSQPTDCWAYIGTCIGAADFAVDADVANHFAPNHKRWDATAQKFFVDLKAANSQQLRILGLPKTQIDISPYSTVADNDRYFSHRKENGYTGRMLAVIGLRS